MADERNEISSVFFFFVFIFLISPEIKEEGK